MASGMPAPLRALVNQADIEIVAGSIRCAVCDKLVERVQIHRDVSDFTTTVTVFCHGSWEASQLTDLQVAEASSIELRDAFTEKKGLENGRRRSDRLLF